MIILPKIVVLDKENYCKVKGLSILCVLSIISFCSCYSSRHIAKDDCQENYNILIEFASKISPYKDTCYVFDFEKEINKFI